MLRPSGLDLCSVPQVSVRSSLNLCSVPQVNSGPQVLRCSVPQVVSPSGRHCPSGRHFTSGQGHFKDSRTSANSGDTIRSTPKTLPDQQGHTLFRTGIVFGRRRVGLLAVYPAYVRAVLRPLIGLEDGPHEAYTDVPVKNPRRKTKSNRPNTGSLSLPWPKLIRRPLSILPRKEITDGEGGRLLRQRIADVITL